MVRAEPSGKTDEDNKERERMHKTNEARVLATCRDFFREAIRAAADAKVLVEVSDDVQWTEQDDVFDALMAFHPALRAVCEECKSHHGHRMGKSCAHDPILKCVVEALPSCKGNKGPFPETMLQWFFDLKKVTDPKDKKAVKPEIAHLLKKQLFLGLKVRRFEARAPPNACLGC